MHLDKQFIVSKADTALAMGSGELEVLATPRCIAMAENTCMLLSENLLKENETTVGTFIDIKHIKPSLVGALINVQVMLTNHDNKKLAFEFELFDREILIGKGQHKRYIVDKKEFMLNTK